jgi:ubiquinone/menaquinone biosynthesis C-methylase UbiE
MDASRVKSPETAASHLGWASKFVKPYCAEVKLAWRPVAENSILECRCNSNGPCYREFIMTKASNSMSLEERYDQVNEVFDVRSFLHRGESLEDVAAYYRESRVGYRLVHSQGGSIHMALNPEGTFNESGYLRAPTLIHERMPALANNVLELGCGPGFNLKVLAERRPHDHFTGVDLTVENVRRAEQVAEKTPNITVVKADFQSLPFLSKTYEAVYSVESFCHALDINAALVEARRVSKTGAKFVVIDGWRTDKVESANDKTRQAIGLTERAMSVGHGRSQSDWLERSQVAGWRLVERMPLSNEVMPNLERFERGGAKALRHIVITRLMQKMLPGRLVGNVVAGYLMAQSVREGWHQYDMLVLEAVPQ